MESKEINFNYSITPWKYPEEYINFYEILFDKKVQSNFESLNVYINKEKNNSYCSLLDNFIESLSLSNLKKSMNYLIKWDLRGDNKMFLLPIILLVNVLIKIKENTINNKDINSCHILAEILIRIINIIMDQLRKTKKANSLNMYLIAKDLDLPEFIIDIRHSSTHKNLPSYNELLFAIEYMFYWIKIKFIDPKYKYYIEERKYFLFLLKQINNNQNNKERENESINKYSPITTLEIDHLLTLISQLFINIKKSFIFKNNKNISYDKSNIQKELLLFKKILNKEKEIFILMIFSFVYQQLTKLNLNEEIKKEDKERYKQFLFSFTKIICENIPKEIKFNLKKCEILYLSIYNNINQLISEIKNKEYNFIKELFLQVFKDFNKNIIPENKDVFRENLGNYKKNIHYIDLDIIEGNTNIINIENLNNIEEEKSISKKSCEQIDMDVEKDINEIINNEIVDNYYNYNSLII